MIALIALAIQGELSQADVSQFCQSKTVSSEAFMNAFSLKIALYYTEQKIDFWEANIAMNNLYTIFHTDIFKISPTCDVFYAFENGEAPQREDEEGVDAEEKYTQTEIASILLTDWNQ